MKFLIGKKKSMGGDVLGGGCAQGKFLWLA